MSRFEWSHTRNDSFIFCKPTYGKEGEKYLIYFVSIFFRPCWQVANNILAKCHLSFFLPSFPTAQPLSGVCIRPSAHKSSPSVRPSAASSSFIAEILEMTLQMCQCCPFCLLSTFYLFIYAKRNNVPSIFFAIRRVFK